MYDVNLLVNLDYLCNGYIDNIKNCLFYAVLGLIIVIILSLYLTTMTKNTIFKSILMIIWAAVACITLLICVLIMLQFFIWPAAFGAGLLKELLLTKYNIVDYNYNIFVNIIVSVISSGIYVFILSKFFKKVFA